MSMRGPTNPERWPIPRTTPQGNLHTALLLAIRKEMPGMDMDMSKMDGGTMDAVKDIMDGLSARHLVSAHGGDGDVNSLLGVTSYDGMLPVTTPSPFVRSTSRHGPTHLGVPCLDDEHGVFCLCFYAHTPPEFGHEPSFNFVFLIP